MLSVRSLTYVYPGETIPALSDVTLDACAGECLCIAGPSGCGKTTLLWAIKGLLHSGSMAGDIQIQQTAKPDGEHPEIGLVFQNAESQILCSTVAEEVAFGPENQCVAPEEIHQRIVRALADVGLAGFDDRNVERLSAGQKHRLAIASVLSMQPKILLLDEPTSQLDRAGKTELACTLTNLKAQGYVLMIAEHDLAPFRNLADRFVMMAEGRIVNIADTAPEAPADETPVPNIDNHLPSDADSPETVSIRGIGLAHPGIGEILSQFHLSVLQGERLHICGPNGSGKSTLLAAIAGVIKPIRGNIRINGQDTSGRKSLFGTVGYLMQNPQRQLFENTVFEEVAFSLKRLKLSVPEIRQRVWEALEICEADHLAERLPLALSFGEQHRVALASVLAPQPSVLLLDEPFAGLDFLQRRRLLAILGRLRKKYQTTILMASHDDLPDRNWPDRVVNIGHDKTLS